MNKEVPGIGGSTIRVGGVLNKEEKKVEGQKIRDTSLLVQGKDTGIFDTQIPALVLTH